jgi:hypothetical protein
MAKIKTGKLKGNVLSVDLAAKNYEDNGIAFISYRGRKPKFPTPSDLGLGGKPSAWDLAATLNSFCQKENVTALLLDGPQGWKSPKTRIDHMRVCERVLNTPAKTGIIGRVKPATFLRYITFSINLFHILRVDYGWNLLTEDWTEHPKTRWIVESFPSFAWRTLGLEKLPAKSKTKPKQLKTWIEDLMMMTGYTLPDALSHDQLQAAVVLPAGQALVQGKPERVVLVGKDPIVKRSGDVLEGWIVNPAFPHK